MNTKPKSNRDYSKYSLEGIIYNKCQLVHAGVVKYLEKNPNATLKELQDVFPSYAIEKLSVARDKSQRQARYLIKDNQILKVAGRRIAVYSQWTKDNIVEFIEAAKKIGMRITVVS